MYQFTFNLYVFVLCIGCIQSAPSELLSALLSPPPPASAPPSLYESNAAAAPVAPSPHGDRHETGLTTYDQKQSGKYNIHLNIKDVAIIALDAGGVDSGLGDSSQDYYEDYDLSDFTVKPVFGLVEISSNKPSTSTTETLPLIHFELDNWIVNATSANHTANGSSSNSTIEEPIIKDPIEEPAKKPQTLEILNENSSELTSGPSTTIAGIVSPTPIIEIANVQSGQKQTPLPLQFQVKPNQIPVEVIYPAQSGRHRQNANWRLKNRATPSHSNRRITSPHSGFEDSPHFAVSASSPIGNNKYRKNSLSHAQRRNCIVDQNGQCQNGQRRFGSPTLNGILNLLSFLSPQQMEKLD